MYTNIYSVAATSIMNEQFFANRAFNFEPPSLWKSIN